MKSIAFATVLLLGFGATAPALADTVRCESSNGRERYCPINTRGGVVLSTQLSSSGCYQGDTWGYDRNGVWVSGGCRAEFSSGGYSGYNYHSSNDYYAGNNRHSNNDGAKVAIALGALIGVAAIASASSKNKNNSSSYQDNYDRGCDSARNDRRDGQSRDYGRHDSRYDSRNEQAFASGYNQCWSR